VSKLVLGTPVFLWKALGVPLGVPVNQASMIEGSVLQYFVDTIDPVISRSLIDLCISGCYSNKNCPDYITKKGYFNLAKRKEALDNIRLHTDTINDVCERIPPETLTVAITMDHMDWLSPEDDMAAEEIKHLNRALAKGGRVMLRSSSKTPWYIKVFEAQGFKCHASATRYSSKSIERVNMYASTWITTKMFSCDEGKIKQLEL
jgi:betaine lipid synthase